MVRARASVRIRAKLTSNLDRFIEKVYLNY